MKQSNHIVAISAFLLIAVSSTLMQSIADTPKTDVLLSTEEQNRHIEIMKNMTPEERASYRNEQYEILRQKAAAIGYEMPDSPPWAESQQLTKADEKPATPQRSSRSAINDISPTDPRHQQQLEKYRQASAEKREQMQARLEKQRQSVQERIDKLVEENSVKPVPEQRPRYVPRTYTPTPPPVPPFPGYYPPPWRSGYYY